MVTALREGTATIRAWQRAEEATAVVTVSGQMIVEHYLEIVDGEGNPVNNDVVLLTGEYQDFSVRYHTVTNGTDDGGVPVTASWSTSNASVATVSGGRVSAYGAGTANITATYTSGGSTCTDVITVNVAGVITTAYRISLTPAETTVGIGGRQTYAVLMYTDIYSDGVLLSRDGTGQVIGNNMLTWTSSDASVAAVSAAGVATGAAAGDVTITARLSSNLAVTATAILHVDTVFDIAPGSGDNGSGGGNY